jgi:hypothetical protein
MSTLRRSSSSYGGFADGVLIRGMPLLTLYPGNVYWVDSNGGGGSKGTFSHPVATILEAHSLVTSDNGDIICVKPGHAETPTATVDFSKSGFAIVGLGFGDNRPTITNGTTTNDDVWDFAGDDIVLYNIYFKEAASDPGGDSTWINCSGDFVHIENCYFELAAYMLGLLTHDTSLATNFHFIGNVVVGTGAGPDFGCKIETLHYHAHFEGNKWMFGRSAGIDTGCIIFTSGTGNGHLIKDEIAIGLGAAGPLLVQTDAQADSLCYNVRLVGDDATTALGASPASGFAFLECMATEPGKGAPPQADGGIGYYPLATTAAA